MQAKLLRLCWNSARSLLAEKLVVVEALLVEYLVTELALAGQRWTMFLPLVFDKPVWFICNEATWCSSGQSQMLFPCFTKILMLIFAVPLFSFLDVIEVAGLCPYLSSPFISVLN